MFKVQKRKSTKFLLILLLFGAFFEACRQKEILPENDTLLSNIKQWFDSQKRPNANKSTTQDTTTWLPQWDNALIQQIDAQTRLVTFPVHRHANVRYYETGFIRRLAVKVNAQEEIIEGHLLEIIGNKEFLYQQKSLLALRYYQGDTLDLSCMFYKRPIASRYWQPNKAGTEVPCTPTSIYNTFDCASGMVSLYNNCGQLLLQTPMSALTATLNCGDSGGGGGGASGGGGWSPPAGGGNPPTGGWEPPTGGGGSGSGSPIYPVYNEEPPCPTCPTDFLVDDPGDNTNPTDEPPGVKLDQSMNNPANQKIKCVWDKLKQMPEIKEMLKGYGSSPNFAKLTIKAEKTLISGALGETVPTDADIDPMHPDPSLNDIIVKIDPVMANGQYAALYIAEVMIHELIHAFWFAKEAKYKAQNPNTGFLDMPAFAPYKTRYGLNRNAIHHECMAQINIQEFTQLLAKFDGNPNGGTVGSMYEMVAWKGLEDSDFYNKQRFPNEESIEGQKYLAKQFLETKMGVNPCQ